MTSVARPAPTTEAGHLSRDELLERTVDDHGLDAAGVRRTPLADGWTVVVSADPAATRVGYLDPDGEYRAIAPASVREASAAALAGVRNEVSALGGTISAERDRLDGLLAADRRWQAADWNDRYLGHPVTGRITRTLIWVFRAADGTEVTGIPCREAGDVVIVTASGGIAEMPADAEVRLWHPAHAGEEEIAQWRELLTGLGASQPVRQVFREQR